MFEVEKFCSMDRPATWSGFANNHPGPYFQKAGDGQMATFGQYVRRPSPVAGIPNARRLDTPKCLSGVAMPHVQQCVGTTLQQLLLLNIVNCYHHELASLLH